jgi:hypothetical protein
MTGLIAMGDRVWLVPRDRFVAAWNESPKLDAAAARVRELASGGRFWRGGWNCAGTASR